MEDDAWPSEHWLALGEQIAKARRIKGWDQAELARRSGNSPNTISNYERGRPTRSRRIPSGLSRVGQALAWPPTAVKDILSGHAPNVAIDQLSLPGMAGGADDVSTSAAHTDKQAPASSTTGFVDAELLDSSALSHDTFVRQMKRYRKLQGVSVDELAELVTCSGYELSAASLKRLENGTALLSANEAKLIAQALGTTVQWLVGSGFSGDAPAEMKGPPDDEELQVEAKAMEQRITRAGMRTNNARMQLDQAKHAEAVAIRQSYYAASVLSQAETVQRELERQYQYLIGRIDSIRAAKGDELIMQVHPVYAQSDEE